MNEYVPMHHRYICGVCKISEQNGTHSTKRWIADGGKRSGKLYEWIYEIYQNIFCQKKKFLIYDDDDFEPLCLLHTSK